MNFLAALLADGIYIGTGFIVLVLVILLIWLLFFRGR